MRGSCLAGGVPEEGAGSGEFLDILFINSGRDIPYVPFGINNPSDAGSPRGIFGWDHKARSGCNCSGDHDVHVL